VSRRAWVQLAGSAIAITVLVWRLGTSPFVHGVRAVDGGVLVAGAGVALLSTLCCAWRWKVVANGLGAELSLPAAVAACYRSIFLNLTLPGGIVGDVHRAVSHGRDVSDVGLAARAVAWERAAGQVVQLVLTIVVLLLLPSPVPSPVPLAALVVLPAMLGIGLVGRVPAWVTPRSVAAITLSSALVVSGHAVTFLMAARAAGTTAPTVSVLPLALLALLVMVLPSVGGWGPREGGTAWVFAMAGLGAQQGVAAAVVYGVMAFVASLPGAVVLVVSWCGRARLGEPIEPSPAEEPAAA
jgi:uncharacterized membrane protein YbhN (UPF0104 family)